MGAEIDADAGRIDKGWNYSSDVQGGGVILNLLFLSIALDKCEDNNDYNDNDYDDKFIYDDGNYDDIPNNYYHAKDRSLTGMVACEGTPPPLTHTQWGIVQSYIRRQKIRHTL